MHEGDVAVLAKEIARDAEELVPAVLIALIVKTGLGGAEGAGVLNRWAMRNLNAGWLTETDIWAIRRGTIKTISQFLFYILKLKLLL